MGDSPLSETVFNNQRQECGVERLQEESCDDEDLSEEEQDEVHDISFNGGAANQEEDQLSEGDDD
jgi:hypothetical protein